MLILCMTKVPCVCVFFIYAWLYWQLCVLVFCRTYHIQYILNLAISNSFLLLFPPQGPDSTAISCDNGHNDTQLTELQPPDSPSNKTPLAPADSLTKENGRRPKKHGHNHSGHSHGGGHGHSHGGNCHSDQEMKDAGIASIAWMVIMGDGMHNFSDGLAIGEQ